MKINTSFTLILLGGEHTQELCMQSKYPSHLSEAEISMLKRHEHPYAIPIYTGKITKVESNEAGQFKVGDTIAFSDDHRW